MESIGHAGIRMHHHPPDDRRISAGAVTAAWAIVVSILAVTLVGSSLKPPRTVDAPIAAQSTPRADDCTDGGETTEEADGVGSRDADAIEPVPSRGENLGKPSPTSRRGW
jgi:hypothetical protein